MRLGFAMAIVLWLGLAAMPAGAGDVVDRILAVVNTAPILLSDWDDAWRCEALLAGRAPESYSVEEQHDIFNRLVDQELMRQQMRGYLLQEITESDVQAREAEVRKQLASTSDAEWKAVLQRAGVTESGLKYHLRRQMELEHFLDSRFRAGIRIDDRSVSRYYYDQFLPELRKAGGKDVPLNDVALKIREILIEQQMGERVTAWVQALREQAEIRIPQEIGKDEVEVDLIPTK